MPDRQEYIERIKHKLDEWNAELARIESAARQQDQGQDMLESIKPEFEEMLEEMQERIEALRSADPESSELIREELDQGWRKLGHELETLAERIVPGN